MEKELYTVPEMEIVEFDAEDIITKSGGGLDEGEVTPGEEEWDP